MESAWFNSGRSEIQLGFFQLQQVNCMLARRLFYRSVRDDVAILHDDALFPKLLAGCV